MDKPIKIALFGESERGSFQTAYFCDNLPQLASNLGNPPEESHGIYCAIQALLYNHSLIYFRVQEEGFSSKDYFQGIQLLEKENLLPVISAVYIPGVGDNEIIIAMTKICLSHSNVLITRETDFYDFITAA